MSKQMKTKLKTGLINSWDSLSDLCSEKIASGSTRDVFVFAKNPNYVVKVERYPRTFTNACEWNNWEYLKYHPELNKWLAPCLDISDDGKYLIQQRVTHALTNEYPDKIPSVFIDLKDTNF